MLSYSWVITRDVLFGQSNSPVSPSEEGKRGPRNVTLSREEMVRHPSAQKFRMLDDDREVYCEGVLVELVEGATTGFEPLDDYGAGGLGCTTIQYWEKGKGGGWTDL